MMQQTGNRVPEFSPEESWRTIHATLARSQSSLYMAGTVYILLLWGAIVSIYFFTLFAIAELAPGFVASYPWYRGPLWGFLGTPGMIGSALIGHREGSRNADHATARSAGLRVFAFWMAVVTAAFLVPGAAGLWSAVQAENIPSCQHRNSLPRLCSLRHHAPPRAGRGWSGDGGGVLFSGLSGGRPGRFGHGGRHAGRNSARCRMDPQE